MTSNQTNPRPSKDNTNSPKERVISVTTRVRCSGTILEGEGVCGKHFRPYYDSDGAQHESADAALTASCLKKSITRENFQSGVNSDRYRVKLSNDWQAEVDYQSTIYDGTNSRLNRRGSCIGIEYIVEY